MSKPTKTEAELIAMARAELKVHADCPDGIRISVLRDGDSWEFRASAEEATIARPGYPECVAMLVQIGDHLCKQYDFKSPTSPPLSTSCHFALRATRSSSFPHSNTDRQFVIHPGVSGRWRSYREPTSSRKP